MFSPIGQEYMPELFTERLIIRKLTTGDAQDIYDYSRDPEVARYVLWYPHRSIADSRFYIKCILRQYRNREPASYGIALKGSGKVVGTIGFSYINNEHGCAEIGYSLAKSQWNKGLMTEALKAMLEYGFWSLNLHRIEATHDVRNPASGKVMEKCGMRLEGVLKGKLYSKGEHIDLAMYAATRDEHRKWKRLEKG
jgi:ribosomal-protein-alanine N-acetyltransferase